MVFPFFLIYSLPSNEANPKFRITTLSREVPLPLSRHMEIQSV